MFKNVNILLRTLALGGLVGVVGWWTVFLRGEIEGHQKQLEVRDREIATLASNLEASEEEILELGEEITQQQEEIRALELSLMLLKVDHRVARVQVLEQTEEVDEAGEEIAGELGRQLFQRSRLPPRVNQTKTNHVIIAEGRRT